MKKKSTFPESTIEVTAKSPGTDRASLRRRLAERLRKVIGNPVIEEKELAAFDIVMTRRDVLKLGRNSLVVAGLVAAGVPPTVWARRDPSLGVHPCEVGLTPEEQASVSKAVDISIGTELFQDTIYAEPLVSPAAVNSHGLIEGARARPRLQSQLTDIDPVEQNFLDKDFHWGPAELIQLEQDSNGDWELVHYHHPWEPRTDGAKTDGLVRQVIMTKEDGLVNPTRVITVTGSSTNSVNYKYTDSTQVTSMSYMVFVEDTAAGDNVVGHLALGTGLANLPAPYDVQPGYPVRWVSQVVDERTVGSYQGYQSADKYTSSGFDFPVAYDPVQSNEFIVLYFQDRIKILFIEDVDNPGFMTLSVNSLEKPDNAPDAHVVHINWNARQNFDGWIELNNVVLASSEKQSDGSMQYSIFSMDRRQGMQSYESNPIAPNILKQIVNWPQAWYDESSTIDAANAEFALDYTAIRDVHTLYKFSRTLPIFGVTTTETFYVKLANFEGRGVVAFIIEEGDGCYGDGTPCYLLGAAFPLSTPSSAAAGEILAFSGGASKFDGLRYVASDENGNLFLFRQRRYIGIDSPYAPPVYGNRDETGQPITSLDPFSAGYLPLPPDTSSTSNLQELQQWISASDLHGDIRYLNYNILLYVALAFATDDTSESQTVWLGNGYKAAYAPSRFAHDSEHIVIKQVQNGGDQIYSAFSVFKNPVDKTWRERQIATQVLPKAPGLNESGDHYQATVTPVNAYGQPVSMLSEENANLVIEVRADSPCTVTDDTHNYYYDIDRYTSFLASPDPGSGHLSLVTKAETFSQVLYVRLVDTSSLSQTTDTALLGATAGALTYAWQSANLAAQAQQRMGNDGTDTVVLLGDTAPLTDTNQYISGDTLTTASQDGDWQFKGGFDPTKNPDNLANLATYLNTSGITMVSASPNLSLAASPDGVTIDPLTAVTAPSPGVSGGARFTYKAGTVTPPMALTATYGSELGSIWSSISHALHDALHWLQNVEETTYQELAEGAVELVVDVDSITAVVSADIMKAVNGVEQELNEVVSTVEEYASIVANVIVTIVEQSFLYKLIEDIIALISLFVHLKDIKSLACALREYITAVVTGPSLIPDDYSSWNEFQSYFGVNNDLADQMNTLDVSSVTTEVTTDVLNAISKNPFTKVIMKIVSSLATAVEDELPTPPISFTPNEQVFDQISDEITALETTLATAFVNLTEDIIEDVITQISADLANPQDTLKNLTTGLETLVAQIEDDVIEPVLDWVDNTARNSQTQMSELINQDQLITVNLTAIKDLMRLFGIGNNINDTYSISSADAIFYPMAIVMWISIYTRTGKSVSGIDGVDCPSSLATTSDLLASSASKTDFNLANIAVNFVGAELTFGIWGVKSVAKITGRTPSALKPLKISGALFNFIRRLCNIAAFWYQNADSGGQITGPVNYVELVFRGGMAVHAGFKIAATLKEGDASPPDNGTWTPTKVVKAATTLGTIGTIVYNAAITAKNNPNPADILAVSGQSLARSQGIARFVWDLIPTEAQATMEESFPYFLIYIGGASYGFVLQAGAVGGGLGTSDSSPGNGRGLSLGLDGGLGSCPRNNGRGKKKGQR